MTISLPDAMVDLVRSAVRTGDYGGISEVIREALRGWHLQRQREAVALGHKTHKEAA